MASRIKLSEVHRLFAEISYPATKASVREKTNGVVLLMADGEEALSAVVERSQATEFVDADDLESEVFMHLPIAAVGEPGQSEGDA